ncbi:MAG: hypothetical protein ACOVQU_02265 [Exiguobacterium acetylicum]
MPKIAIVTSYPIELGGQVFPVGTELARFESKHEVDRLVSLLGAKAAVMTELSDEAEAAAVVVAEVDSVKTSSETVDPATSKADTDTVSERGSDAVTFEGLDSRLVKVLSDFGLMSWEELAGSLDNGLELDSIPGVGKKAIPKIMTAFEAYFESLEEKTAVDAPLTGRSDPAAEDEDIDDEDDLSPDE